MSSDIHRTQHVSRRSRPAWRMVLASAVAGAALWVAPFTGVSHSAAGVRSRPSVRPDSAQDASSPVTITFGDSAAPPDAEVVVPMSMSVPDGIPVGAIDVRLGFPKSQLAFVKIEPSGLAIGVGAELQAEVAEQAGGQILLQLRVFTKRDGNGQKPLPTGPLAYVAFKIDKSAKPETEIPLAHEATASTTEAPPRPITPVVAAPVAITVARPPVPACFLYMH
jgi:hypothetical protein